MKQLLNTNIHILQVEEGIEEFKKADFELGFYWIEHRSKYGCTKIPVPFNFQIIGTITSDRKFDFDCEPFVESQDNINDEEESCDISYYDYESGCFDIDESEDSFLSLLEASWKYFVNPFARPRIKNYVSLWGKSVEFEDDLKVWQQAESNTLQSGYKWLLIQQTNK